MKNLKTTILTLTAATMLTLSAGSAARADDFAFSFNTGDVAFAYNDGYWDNAHRWHRWHNVREARAYRERYGDHYHSWRHTRDHDHGWRDR